MSRPDAAQFRSGLTYAFFAYGLWGLVPLYFNALVCSPKEIVAHRVIWSMVFLTLLVTVLRRWPEVMKAFRNRRTLLMLLASAYLVAANWFVYVTSTTTGHITQASLGYFILPLVNVLAGIALFRDRLRPAQIIALLVAAAGVAYLTIALGEFPWISLILAVSFAAYGIVRKITPVDGVVGLTVETVLLAPTAIVLLVVWTRAGETTFGTDRSQDLLMAASGIVTTLPLICFAQAVRRVSLVTIGVMQYLSPSLQLVSAIFVFGETFAVPQQISFGLIWLGLALYMIDGVRFASRRPSPTPVTEPIDGGVPLSDSELQRIDD